MLLWIAVAVPPMDRFSIRGSSTDILSSAHPDSNMTPTITMIAGHAIVILMLRFTCCMDSIPTASLCTFLKESIRNTSYQSMVQVLNECLNKAEQFHMDHAGAGGTSVLESYKKTPPSRERSLGYPLLLCKGRKTTARQARRSSHYTTLGNRVSKVVLCRSLRTRISPPWTSTMLFVMAKPKPVPPVCFDREASTR